MAKLSSIQKQLNRTKLVAKYAEKRASLKLLLTDDGVSVEEKFKARMKLAKLPRNSCPTRLKSRCLVTGRSKAFYRKMKVSRIILREYGSKGLIPGIVKSSW